MVEFQERHFSNGSTLLKFQKQKVSCFVKVESIMEKKFKGKTTDDKNVMVFGDDLPTREGEWVEVIGTPRGQEQLAADEVSTLNWMIRLQIKSLYFQVISFANGGAEFDAESHNYLIQVLNNAEQLFNLQ